MNANRSMNFEIIVETTDSSKAVAVQVSDERQLKQVLRDFGVDTRELLFVSIKRMP